MNIVNCTKHAVRLCDNDGQLIREWAPGAVETRVAEEFYGTSGISIPELPGKFVDLHEWSFGEVVDLPEPEEGTMFIVSAMVISALLQKGVKRPDLISPHTGRGMIVQRDGAIWGVKAFRRQM